VSDHDWLETFSSVELLELLEESPLLWLLLETLTDVDPSVPEMVFCTVPFWGTGMSYPLTDTRVFDGPDELPELLVVSDTELEDKGAALDWPDWG